MLKKKRRSVPGRRFALPKMERHRGGRTAVPHNLPTADPSKVAGWDTGEGRVLVR